MAHEDEGLIEDAKVNIDKYAKLYKKYLKKVYEYFWYRIGYNKEIAEDLTQETFLRAFRDFPRFEFRNFSYLSYLLRIGHNLLVNYYRKQKTVPLPEPERLPSIVIADIKDVEQRSDSLLVWDVMKDLPINEQNVLILYYWDDLSVRDIAVILDKSENAVKLLLSRGRKRLALDSRFTDFEEVPERLRDVDTGSK